MSDHVVLINDAITSKHVSAVSCDSEGFSAVVTLKNRNHFWCKLVSVFEDAELVDCVQAKCDLC